jgi:hypothetical protein
MRTAKLWKPLAGIAVTFTMLLAGAGVSGAANDEHPPPVNCATAEHVGVGLAYHQLDKDCSGFLG